MRLWVLIVLAVGLLAKTNTPFTLYKLQGQNKGPTLLVFGGIHGNEPGGYFAPSVLVKHYRIKKGALWIAPNLNPDSIARFLRGRYGDMNRKFAAIAPDDPDRETIERIKALILKPEIDLILNLHDGHGFYRDRWQNAIFNPKAWGQACIIDQKCLEKPSRFADLDELARRVSARLNDKLFKEHHIFNVKNTQTRMKDEQMRLSLTYFAITHGKPAMAIETSKNITSLPMKVLYQLRAIEAFMDEMGIEYSRDFDLNLDSIEKILQSYGTIVLNDDFLVPLDGIDKVLRHVPLRPSGNRITRADHPLASLIKIKGGYQIRIGHRTVCTLYPDTAKGGKRLARVKVVTDGRDQTADVPSVVTFRERFVVKAPEGIRVNVIGFSKPGLKNENGVTIRFGDLRPKYAMDRANRLFRAEFYRGKRYVGMIVLQKVP